MSARRAVPRSEEAGDSCGRYARRRRSAVSITEVFCPADTTAETAFTADNDAAESPFAVTAAEQAKISEVALDEDGALPW